MKPVDILGYHRGYKPRILKPRKRAVRHPGGGILVYHTLTVEGVKLLGG